MRGGGEYGKEGVDAFREIEKAIRERVGDCGWERESWHQGYPKDSLDLQWIEYGRTASKAECRDCQRGEKGGRKTMFRFQIYFPPLDCQRIASVTAVFGGRKTLPNC